MIDKGSFSIQLPTTISKRHTFQAANLNRPNTPQVFQFESTHVLSPVTFNALVKSRICSLKTRETVQYIDFGRIHWCAFSIQLAVLAGLFQV